MKERKEKFPTSWLSRQQKEILKTVCDKWTDNPEPIQTKTLNWDIARKFDNEQDNRIEMGKKGKEILSQNHRISMNKSLKRLRERELILEKDLFGKGLVGISEEGKSWCEINIDGFKEKREKKELMRTEKIKKSPQESYKKTT